MKTARFKNHVIFSLRCKHEGFLPKSLVIRSPIDTERGRKIADRANRQFLNERLRVSNFRLRQLEDERKWREIGLRRTVSDEDFERITRMAGEAAEFEYIRTKERHIRKLDKLREDYLINSTTPTEDIRKQKKRWVLNLSSHKLSEDTRSTLARGFNFCRTPSTIPKTEIIAGVETALAQQHRIPPERKETVRAAIANVLRSAKPPSAANVTPAERDALRKLETNADITILPADKGNATVILDTLDYVEKAKELLENPPFRKLKKDPTGRNEKKVNETLRKLAREDVTNANLFKSLQVPYNGTKPAMFYGSVKIHKDGYPLRPIVSAIGSATYGIARHLSKILTAYSARMPSYIRNTADFVEKLSTVEIEDGETMVSFDVKSLFTNVPIDKAAEATHDLLRTDNHLDERTNLKIESIMTLLNLCLTTTSFQFREQHYELTDGLPMGSPASPCVANIFIAQLEQKAIASFLSPPKLWLRFVDDVFSILKKNAVENLLEHLNSQHRSITFTVEREVDHQLPFMDVKVHRNERSLKTSVYRKPTHTGRYLNYESHHPDSSKKAVILALARRMEYVTVNEEEKRVEEERIVRDLALNGYPEAMVRKVMRRQARQKDGTTANGKTLTQSHNPVTCSIPYVRGTSEAIDRILRPLDIRTVMKPHKIKWSLMKGAKDMISADREPGVVYALGCMECPSVYIGETARTAKQRVKEHNMHTRTGHTDLSAVANHAHTEGHRIHWEPRILAREKNTSRRKIKEALAIRKLIRQRGEDAGMNQDTGRDISKLWIDLF